MGSNDGADDERPLHRVQVDSWVTHDADQLRRAHRHKVPPDTDVYSIGFRVVYSDDGIPDQGS